MGGEGIQPNPDLLISSSHREAKKNSFWGDLGELYNTAKNRFRLNFGNGGAID